MAFQNTLDRPPPRLSQPISRVERSRHRRSADLCSRALRFVQSLLSSSSAASSPAAPAASSTRVPACVRERERERGLYLRHAARSLDKRANRLALLKNSRLDTSHFLVRGGSLFSLREDGRFGEGRTCSHSRHVERDVFLAQAVVHANRSAAAKPAKTGGKKPKPAATSVAKPASKPRIALFGRGTLTNKHRGVFFFCLSRG